MLSFESIPEGTGFFFLFSFFLFVSLAFMHWRHDLIKEIKNNALQILLGWISEVQKGGKHVKIGEIWWKCCRAFCPFNPLAIMAYKLCNLLYWRWYCIFDLFSVPRILFDQWTLNDYHIIFSSDTALQSLVDTIVSFIKVGSCKYSFNVLRFSYEL